MSVALVHYHLRAGGVTRVLEAQSQALTRAGINHVILAGSPYQGPANLPVAVLPALDYTECTPTLSGSALLAEMRHAATIALRGAPHTWHLHNPAMGKNVLFPTLIQELAAAQEQLVLHFHDFAEDGRPTNYKLIRDELSLYPLAPQIRYTFINSRDRDLLIEAGVPSEQTTLLPNAVTPPAVARSAPREPSAPATVLYPVRGIRRKNLGELCLLSGLAPEEVTFALSLAPENPAWRTIYEQWVDAVEHFHLPVQMGVVGKIAPAPGLEPTYANWLAHSSHLITTSVAEGFGLAFLEPLGMGKPLLGRDLPEITADFKQDEGPLGDLYEDLLIPAEWVDPRRLLDTLREQLREVYRAYGAPLPNGILKESREALDLGDYFDFGNLPEAIQLEVLPHALVSPDDVMIGRNGRSSPAVDWLEKTLASTAPAGDPAQLEPYSVSRYAERHASLYQELASAPPQAPTWLDKSKVLAQFLKPERFHFLRT
jgi:hypothetical protein